MFTIFLVLTNSLSLQEQEKSFIKWMRKTNQYFNKDDYHIRLGLFLANSQLVEESNHLSGRQFKIDMNRFACYTPAEYKQLLGAKLNERTQQVRSKIIVTRYLNSASIDWRDRGVVGSIRDQGNCGSCWAFSACQAMESVYAIRYGELPEFSPKNLVDCNTRGYGCDGSMPCTAIDWVTEMQNGKIMLEKDYPYVPVQSTCLFDETKAKGTFNYYLISNFDDEDQLASNVESHGPMSVCIDASTTNFRLYSSGIFYDETCRSDYINHAVGCVGFGDVDGAEYWILKNSWGADWGENGYIRLARNKGNHCAIAYFAIAPILN
ncbi:Crustapain [Tritrichomonas foetus]|uniref:Crustapain n=1 Tax=Tritrichomonas foetus TaxID=1144522 RepID=A0A1J4KGA5_9EUKA|nr:Crustapain [Tritrichomonas foetus]|eukprot:OHT10066.1 Crustapain [Tritrichomonas foetus]